MRHHAVILTLLLAGCAGGSTVGPNDLDELTPDAALSDGNPGAFDGASPPPVVLAEVSTRRLGNLVGSQRTPLAPVGLIGTDLGVSFERDGKLVFLFGDSWTTEAERSYWDDDSAAWSSPEYPSVGLPQLNWYTGPTGRFLTLDVPLTQLGAMNVPVEGIPHGERTYLFFSAGFSDQTQRHSHSVLAHMAGLDFAHLAFDHSAPSEKFINIQAVREGDAVWLWGSGAYRKSAVYLARVRLDDLPYRDRWRYWDGAALVAGEGNAAPLFPAACVGELSVRKHPSLPTYLMAYNCDAPRGVHLRYAPSPTGPWSEPMLIFDPGPDADRGYAHFMHANADVFGYDDGLSEAGRDAEWGGEYGPYLVPQWFREPAPGVHVISWVLSSWNPYTVHLMETVLVEPGATAVIEEPGTGLPPATLVNGDFASGTFAGWQTEGDGFGLFVGGDGQRRLTTYVMPKGDGVVGRIWQDFTVDASTKALVFSIHGGHGTVSLWDGADRVRLVRGRDSNASEVLVRWQLAGLRGKTLRLVVEDQLTEAWGFIGTTGFRFER